MLNLCKLCEIKDDNSSEWQNNMLTLLYVLHIRMSKFMR